MEAEQRLRLGRMLDLFLLVSLALLLGTRLWISGLQAAFAMPGLNLYVAALAALCLSLWLWRRLLDGPGAAGLRALAPALVLLAWAGLSCTWAVNPDAAWRQVIDAAAAFAVLVVVAEAAREAEFRRRVLSLLLACAVAIAGLALWEATVELAAAQRAYEADPDILRVPERLRAAFVGRLYENAASGSFLISNILAGFLCLPLGLCVACAAAQELPGRLRALAGAGAALFAATLLATRSRAGIGCGLVACALALLVRKSGRKRLALALLGMLLLGGLGFGIAVSQRGLENVPGGTALAVRLEYWQGALAAALEQPWRGYGQGGFATVYPAFRPERSEDTRFAHSLPVQTLTDLGLPGLSLLLATVYLWMRRLARAASVEGQTPDSTDGARRTRDVAGVSGLLLAVAMVGLLGLKWRGEKALALAALSGCGYLVGARLFAGTPVRVLGCGLAAGLAGLGLHGLLDLDFSSPGVLMAAAVAVGCGLALGDPREAFPRRPFAGLSRARLGAACAGLLPFLALVFWMIPPEIEADRLLGEAQAALEDEAQPRAEALDAAAAALLEAGRLRPLAPAPKVELATVLAEAWGRAPAGPERERLAHGVLETLREAARLDPYSADLPFRAGCFLLEGGERRLAIGFFHEAIALEPSHPHYHFQLGEALFPSDPAAAADAYAEALRLSGVVRNDFRQLGEAEEARARQRGG